MKKVVTSYQRKEIFTKEDFIRAIHRNYSAADNKIIDEYDLYCKGRRGIRHGGENVSIVANNNYSRIYQRTLRILKKIEKEILSKEKPTDDVSIAPEGNELSISRVVHVLSTFPTLASVGLNSLIEEVSQDHCPICLHHFFISRNNDTVISEYGEIPCPYGYYHETH